ncbi:TetR/AcrR family transcriptional regulator [Mycobacterium sp. pW049]|uniref:TetR/AcrR family transcriptional regulator n=1 Tax=[Mycobacterium] bulgaricum TaxID=3238985 RepID=UPI00351B1583
MSDEPNGMRAPVQARSHESTERILDGALSVLDRAGLSGLTMAAVANEAAMSIGAIYHRFADRRHLLIAVQDRFLSRLERDWLNTSAPIWATEDRDEQLHRLVAAFTETFATHRNAFKAFMVTGNDDPGLRARGNESSGRFAAYFAAQLTERFGCPPDAAEAAYRLLLADAVLSIMFSPAEVTGASAPAARPAHLVAAIRAVLTAAGSTGTN